LHPCSVDFDFGFKPTVVGAVEEIPPLVSSPELASAGAIIPFLLDAPEQIIDYRIPFSIVVLAEFLEHLIRKVHPRILVASRACDVTVDALVIILTQLVPA
jgi:hypothetical protein